MRNSILRVRPKIACHAPPDTVSVSCSNIAQGGLDGLDGWAWTGLVGFVLAYLPAPACACLRLPARRVARQATAIVAGQWRQSAIVVPSPLRPSGTKSRTLTRTFNPDLRSVPPAQSSRSSLQSAHSDTHVRSHLHAP